MHQRILADLAWAGAGAGGWYRPALRLAMPEQADSVAQDSLLRGLSRAVAPGMLVFARDDDALRPSRRVLSGGMLQHDHRPDS